MWLPKDEIKLLTFLYCEMFKLYPRDTIRPSVENLMYALGYKFDSNQKQQDNNPFIWRVWNALESLYQRELIGHSGNLRIIEGWQLWLTLPGRDLGRKYNSKWLRIKLWYEEYIKNHPIWLIGSFLGGVITGLLVNWLSKIFG